MIATAVGYIAIEAIEAGDWVWATNPETGETELKEVVQLFRNETEEWVHVTVNGGEITCTPNHPFYSPVKGWTSAIDLRAGDRLQLLNGEYVVIEQVQHELLESPVVTYNFEVEGFHTYYVGYTEVLVHNKCSDVDKMSSQEANKIRDDIMSGKDVTFNSKDDAVKFINKKFPSYPQEVAGHRSAQGWHFDRHAIKGIIKDHINIYSKNPKFNSHIFWD